MVGRTSRTCSPRRAGARRRGGAARSSDLAVAPATVHGVASPSRGEILGFAGLVGAGRPSWSQAIFGAPGRPRRRGPARRQARVRAPEDAIAAGIALRARGPQGARPGPAQSSRSTSRLPAATASAARGCVDRRQRGAAGRRDDVEQLDIEPPRPSRRSDAVAAATSRRSCWASGSLTGPRCSSSTSRPAASTSAPRPRSTRSCDAGRARRRRDHDLLRAARVHGHERPHPGDVRGAGRVRFAASEATEEAIMSYATGSA